MRDNPALFMLALGLAMATIIAASFTFSGPDTAKVEECAKIENEAKSVACFEAIQ